MPSRPQTATASRRSSSARQVAAAVVVPVLHEQAGDRRAGALQQQRGDRRVDAAGHADDDCARCVASRSWLTPAAARSQRKPASGELVVDTRQTSGLRWRPRAAAIRSRVIHSARRCRRRADASGRAGPARRRSEAQIMAAVLRARRLPLVDADEGGQARRPAGFLQRFAHAPRRPAISSGSRWPAGWLSTTRPFTVPRPSASVRRARRRRRR